MKNKMIKIQICSFVFLVLMVSPALSNQKIIFKDHYGNDVILDKVADRVVAIPKPAPAMYISVDGNCKKMVGMHPSSMAAIQEGIFKDMFPNALKISYDIGNKGNFVPNVEQMLGLNPDIVFQWGNKGMLGSTESGITFYVEMAFHGFSSREDQLGYSQGDERKI